MNSRAAAFALLVAVAEQRRPLDEALASLPTTLPDRDRAAAHRLAASVLRREGTLAAVLEPLLRRAPPPAVGRVLRLGAAELLLLGTPPHAAVSNAVALARAEQLASFSGLVNAVLRRVAVAGPALLDRLDGPRLDTPSWLWTSWGDRARPIAEAHATGEPPLDLALRPGAAPPPDAEALPPHGARVPAGTRVTNLPGFAEGAFWVQDQAAGLPVRLLDPRPGERVLDLCAAPGGKTAQLVLAGTRVTALDRDRRRLERLADNLRRLRLEAMVVHADALEWSPPAGERFDAILLDAPCTATGTIRRHPEIVRLRRPSDVATLAATQRALLDRARRWLAPGGRLLYAVCSLQPDEGEHQVAQALASGAWLRDPAAPAAAAALPGRTEAGDIRTDPAMGMDGFYAARLLAA